MRTTLGALILAAGFAATAAAGTVYNYRSETTGSRPVLMTGKVEVEGKNLRMDVTKGDGTLFKDGTVVYSTNGAQSMTVVDPATKTYFTLDMESLVGGPASMFKQMGDMVQISFDNPKVAVKDNGAGGTVEGFPTKRTRLDATYDLNIAAMGQKMSTKIAMSTESWSTDKIPAESMNWFQKSSAHTGIEGLDKLIEAQGSALKGRFPLKTVSTVTTTRNGQSQSVTTTATVTNVVTKPIPAAEFVMPAGYTKTENPIEKMMSGFKSIKK